jgi:murein DD-endopeptidase MepM/ murein hydrolase activator NlpD
VTFPHAWTPLSVRRGPAARGLAAAVTGLLATAVLLPGPATALTPPTSGSLEDRREAVSGRLDRADAALDDSSAAVRRATSALLQARADLADAEAVLASTRAELAVARARDQRMQARLDAARARLDRARAALAEGRVAAAEQTAELRRMAAATYEQGGAGIAGLSMVLTTQDPAQLAGRLNASNSVLNSESAVLDRLTATRVVLDVQEQETAAAEADVARRREEAAANLDRSEALEAQAADAASRVAQLVEVKAGARRSALSVRRTDLRQLDNLQAERDRITALIRRQATTSSSSSSSLSASVDASGGYLSMPTQGWITSGYGWRIHPIFGYRSLHDGIDIGAGCGTPVVAAADGTVLSEYYSTSYGNRLIIDHGLQRGVGLATISNHLSRYAVGTGAHVERGQVIAYVGTTGWSTGCHLHFTVLQNGVAVDPTGWL